MAPRGVVGGGKLKWSLSLPHFTRKDIGRFDFRFEDGREGAAKVSQARRRMMRTGMAAEKAGELEDVKGVRWCADLRREVRVRRSCKGMATAMAMAMEMRQEGGRQVKK
jgi:hypothetical protein